MQEHSIDVIPEAASGARKSRASEEGILALADVPGNLIS